MHLFADAVQESILFLFFRTKQRCQKLLTPQTYLEEVTYIYIHNTFIVCIYIYIDIQWFQGLDLKSRHPGPRPKWRRVAAAALAPLCRERAGSPWSGYEFPAAWFCAQAEFILKRQLLRTGRRTCWLKSKRATQSSGRCPEGAQGLHKGRVHPQDSKGNERDKVYNIQHIIQQ